MEREGADLLAGRACKADTLAGAIKEFYQETFSTERAGDARLVIGPGQIFDTSAWFHKTIRGSLGVQLCRQDATQGQLATIDTLHERIFAQSQARDDFSMW